jgi:hypothetical protein
MQVPENTKKINPFRAKTLRQEVSLKFRAWMQSNWIKCIPWTFFFTWLGDDAPDSDVIVTLTGSAELPRPDGELECWFGLPDTEPKQMFNLIILYMLCIVSLVC